MPTNTNNYKDATATAWGGEQIYIAEANADGLMPQDDSFSLLGIIKEDSIGLDSQDGKKKNYTATGGRLIDSLTGEPTQSIKCILKGLPKSVLEKVWKVKVVENKLQISKYTNNKHYAIKMADDGVGTEVVKFAKCSVSAKQIYSEDGGFELEVVFTVLDTGTDNPKQIIEVKA